MSGRLASSRCTWESGYGRYVKPLRRTSWRAIGLLYAQGPTLQDVSIQLTSLLGGGVLAIDLLGFGTRIGDARAVWGAVACTLAFILWTMGLSPESWSVPFDTDYTGRSGTP